MEAGGIALAILGVCNDQIRDNRRHGRPEILKRFAGIVESLAHSEGRGVVEPNVLDRSESHRHLPKYERERRSVSQSPRLEAVSVMKHAIPPKGQLLFNTDHFSVLPTSWHVQSIGNPRARWA
jgi:hypothetical protein